MTPDEAQRAIHDAEALRSNLPADCWRALETIAGMRPEYAVQVLRSGEWQYSRGEDDFRWQDLAVQMVREDRDHPGEETRLVRRYVTEPEEIE